MNEYLVKKLKQGRIDKGLKQSDVATQIGVKGNTLSNYENGVSEPDIDTFCSLCDIYGMDPAEILGEAYGLNVQGTDFDIKPSEMKLIEKYRDLDPFGQETVSYILDREVDRVQQISNAYKEGRSAAHFPTYYMAYYHSLASAGNGEYIFEDLPTDTIEVPLNELSHRADFVIGVNGDSMEPTYYDGEKVYVEKMQVLEIGDIGIFMINNECFIKEVGEDGLISHNPKYDIISGSENIECIGKVLGKVELSDPAKIQTLSSEGVRARNIGKTLLGNKNHKQKQK
ncbi:LexA repressor [[Eubacterium] contortum]|uniref:LexA repressor n=1 Tax=Faecalicatena contorta TaxID=39482 RepID=A0A174IHK1_9FIRM|nr:XRE family transcriptional regulator [Faecalicatena contorta]CUO85891.1 LexA repressor [[Eubacterium] contortum] [Faecalicatena contorta]